MGLLDGTAWEADFGTNETNRKGDDKMTNKFNIENLAGKGIKAVVNDGGAQYSTYRDFARAAGHPDAAVESDSRDLIVSAYGLKGSVVNVLAKGKHGAGYTDIYVCQTTSGDKFLIGERGIELIHPPVNALADFTFDELLDELMKRVQAEMTPQQRITFAPPTREEIVRMAREDVAELTALGLDGTRTVTEGNTTFQEHYYEPDFVFNPEKNTVVALIFHMSFGKYRQNGVVRRGIAKCDPSDCFNEHIGKAIALRRALGLEVPADYLNAPQPEGIEPGDVVRGQLTKEIAFVRSVGSNGYAYGTYASGRELFAAEVDVINDSARYL